VPVVGKYLIQFSASREPCSTATAGVDGFCSTRIGPRIH
jgi:hypothetical protein